MRVLFLTHRVPYAANRGDRTRAMHLIRTLAPHVEVEVVSLAHDADELAQVERVRELGVRASAALIPRARNYARAVQRLAGTTPLTHLLLDSPGMGPILQEVVRERPPDVVLSYCTGMARFALEPPLDRFPLVIDFVDVDSEKWRVLSGASSSGWRRWFYAREARVLAEFEARAATVARAVLVVNEREERALRHIAPEARIHVVPIGVERSVVPVVVGQATPSAVAFCGVMNYAPNVDAVLWFAREVWPTVKAARPEARFVIIGATPAAAIQRLASEDAGIEVTGTVPEVTSHLARCSVAVAPLHIARGVQNKVLEALSVGLPAVVTSPVAEGLPTVALAACRVADAASDFARHVVDLLALGPDERRALAACANLDTLTWHRQLSQLPSILAGATYVATDIV